MSEAPPGNGKGLDGNTAKALISTPRQTRRQTGLATEELVFDQNTVKTFNGIGGEK
jgi:hypothetical protein